MLDHIPELWTWVDEIALGCGKVELGSGAVVRSADRSACDSMSSDDTPNDVSKTFDKLMYFIAYVILVLSSLHCFIALSISPK